MSGCLGPCQWIDGTRVLPRRLALPHQSPSTTIQYRRYHSVQDSWSGYTNRASGDGDSRCSTEEIEVSWLHLHLSCKKFTLLLNRRSTKAAASNPEDQLVLTKGDNNPVDDIALYRGLKYLERKHVVGKVRGYASAFDVPSLVPFLNSKI